MNVGIIGYGSMGKMLLEKFAESGSICSDCLFVYNRNPEKLADVATKYNVTSSSAELVSKCDIVFICVRPGDMKDVFENIKSSVKEGTLLVSLNGSITFDMLERIIPTSIAKVIPSVTAEINKSQTLVCYNSKVCEREKQNLVSLLQMIGTVIELPEKELGMGSELVSCMPGFIAAIFDCLVSDARKHTSLSEAQIIDMVLNTLNATSDLMLSSNMSFGDVVTRVATKGGITEEGTRVIYDGFPEICSDLFEKTLDKRNATAKMTEKMFD